MILLNRREKYCYGLKKFTEAVKNYVRLVPCSVFGIFENKKAKYKTKIH